MCIACMSMCSADGGQKMEPDLWELELQEVLPHPAGAGNPAPDLNNTCS